MRKRMRDFALEVYFAKWEFNARYKWRDRTRRTWP